MAKISYDKLKTQDVLDQLNDANSKLNGTEQELQAAISTIKNARGIEYITGLDFSGIIESPSQCQDYIKNQIKTISTRVQDIEEYNEDVGNTNFFLRGLATFGLVEAKLSEGFGKACESVVDGLASGIGWVVGLFSPKAKKKIGDFVAKDWTGEYFDNSYTRMLDKYSYMSADSTGAKILKGVGEAAGYVAIAMATAGVGSAVGAAGEGASVATAFANGARAAGSSVKAMAAVAGVAGVGEGTQSGLQQGLDYNKALTQGIKTGALSAATVVVTNYALNGLVKGAKLIKNSKVGTIATNAISKGVNKIKTPISKIASKVKTPISKAANKVKTPISKAASKIKEPVSKATSKIKNTASKVTNKFTKGASTAEAGAAENAAAKGAANATKGASAAENATAKGAANATKGASAAENATAKGAANATKGASAAENATAKGATNNATKFTVDDNADDIIDAFKNGKMSKDEFKNLMENKAKVENEAYSKLEQQYGKNKIPKAQKDAYLNTMKKVHPDNVDNIINSVENGAANTGKAAASEAANAGKAATSEAANAGKAATSEAANTSDDIARAAASKERPPELPGELSDGRTIKSDGTISEKPRLPGPTATEKPAGLPGPTATETPLGLPGPTASSGRRPAVVLPIFGDDDNKSQPMPNQPDILTTPNPVSSNPSVSALPVNDPTPKPKSTSTPVPNPKPDPTPPTNNPTPRATTISPTSSTPKNNSGSASAPKTNLGATYNPVSSPDPTPTPTSTPDPTPTFTPEPAPTSTPEPTPTPTPTPTYTPSPTPTVTPNTPTPVQEYSEIPNTGFNKKSNGLNDYIAPAILGGITGISGAVAATRYKDYKDEKDDKNINNKENKNNIENKEDII